MTSEEKALHIKIEKLEKEAEIMKRLSTRQGFFDMYYEILPNHDTYESAFHFVNDLYYNLFGEHRYADHKVFKNVTNYYNRKNKK